MINDVITRARTKQDKEYKEKSSIQPDLIKFQQDLVEGFKTFVNLAIENNVSGVGIKEFNDLGEGIREFCFQVDEEDFVLVMRDDIYPTDFTKKKIGNLTYVYYDGDILYTPIIEIQIYKDLDNSKFYSVSWFSTNGKKPITGDMNFDENSGLKVAEAILNYFYNRQKCWKEKPSREGFSSKKSKKGNIGFLLSNPKQ